MDYINQEALTMTLASYQEAMQKLFAISKHVVPDGNHFNDSLPTEWRMEWVAVSIADRVQHTTKVIAQADRLVEYGRPKLGYTMNFIRLTGYAEFSFNWYGVYAPSAALQPYTDEDVEDHPGRPAEPERIKATQKRLHVLLYSKHWSLESYCKDKGAVLHFLDAAPDGIQQEWISNLSFADEQIRKYNELVEQIKPI